MTTYCTGHGKQKLEELHMHYKACGKRFYVLALFEIYYQDSTMQSINSCLKRLKYTDEYTVAIDTGLLANVR